MRYKVSANWRTQLIAYSLSLMAICCFAQDNYHAIALYNDGNYLEAIDACNALIKANKHDTTAYAYRGLSKERIKDYEGARKDFKKLSNWNPKDARTHFKLGVLWSETEDYYHSIKEYTKAIKLDSGYAVAYNNRGNSEYLVGDGKNAMNDFTSAAKADSTYPDPLYNRGHLKMVLNNNYGAINDFSRAIELDPGDADAWFSRAQAYDVIKDTLKAVNDYDNVLHIDSSYMDVYYYRGCDLFKLGYYEDAMNDFSESLTSDSSYYLVYTLRGIAFDSLGEYTPAIEDFTNAIRLELNEEKTDNQTEGFRADNGQAYFGRGYAYLQEGDKESACEDFNMAYYYGSRGKLKELLDENCKGHVKIYYK